MDLFTGILIGCIFGLVFMFICIPIGRIFKEKKARKKELEKESNSNFDYDYD